MRPAEAEGERTRLAKTMMSSLNDSDEQGSPPLFGSRGELVASSHFSKMSASSGKSGWLVVGGDEGGTGRDERREGLMR